MEEKDGSQYLCRKCGRCCCAKLILEEEIVFTPYFCKYLDLHSRLCTVYEKRFEMNLDCLSVKDGLELGVFPADCPYTQNVTDYVPPRESWTQQERILFDHFVRQMDNIDPQSADDEIDKTDDRE